jgi:hypothetical protein
LKPADDLRILFDQTGTHAQFVRDHLDAYNVAVTGISGWYPLYLFLRNRHGETMGAFWGTSGAAGCISPFCGSMRPCAVGTGGRG